MFERYEVVSSTEMRAQINYSLLQCYVKLNLNQRSKLLVELLHV